MNFGFSYVGLFYLLMLTIPNLIWTQNKPTGYTAKDENKLLVLCERVGQASVTITVLIFNDFNLELFSFRGLWLVISFIFMIAYEYWWIRYFRSEKTSKDFYSSFIGVPVAGATLPVIAFFLLGVYGKNPILMVSVIILGIGHIGIHLEHKKKKALQLRKE